MEFCIWCSKPINERGWCSIECHDKYYDSIGVINGMGDF